MPLITAVCRRFVVPVLLAALSVGALLPTAAQAGPRYYGWGHGGYRTGGWGHVGVLPVLATVLTVGAITYWVADGQYYRAAPTGGYVLVAPPAEVTPSVVVGAAAASSSAADKLYVYPRNGQTADQQATDEYDCHRWAVGQTGFDPAAGVAGSGEQRRNYQRAQGACLDGRGYTAR